MKCSFKTILQLAIVPLFFAGCVKKAEPLTSYAVSVEFRNTGSKYDLTGDRDLNPKDSVYLNFTIASSREDMAVVEIQKNGTKIDTFNVSPGAGRQFSASKKYLVDSMAGAYTYRVLARNANGIYIGDGSKSIKVTVLPDFDFYSYRFLYVPDSTAKTSPAFYSTSTGQTFSYSNIGSNSSLIDFGYVYDTAVANKHTIYALNTSPLPTQVSGIYDLSTWTKNATVFKRVTTPSFASITSGGALRTAGIANLASGTASKITLLTAGNIILFKTVTGKYGIIQINFIEGASASPSTYINIDVKVQR